MELGLKNKKVLITGASQGIGKGIAQAFAKEGANLLLVARSDEKLKALAEELQNEYSIDVKYLAVDLSLVDAVDQIKSFVGQDLDILVNNAGDVPSGDLWKVDAEQWKAGWEVKVYGFINLTRALYPLMKNRENAAIVNIIGIAGERLTYDYIAGSTGNAALIAFTKSMGAYSLDDGIRINGINPGPIETERIHKLIGHAKSSGPEAIAALQEKLKMLPAKRMGRVEEIADVVLFLASNKALYISGTIVNVDGGMSNRGTIS